MRAKAPCALKLANIPKENLLAELEKKARDVDIKSRKEFELALLKLAEQTGRYEFRDILYEELVSLNSIWHGYIPKKNLIQQFETAYAKIGVYICYDRHFPECARLLALKGAEILFNPSATTTGKSQHLWELEQPAQAVANGVFIGANNRVGLEKPWEFGKFYGSSYFVDPRGDLLVKGSEDNDEVVIADLDLDQIREVRDGWQFFRDLRPDMYTDLTRPGTI